MERINLDDLYEEKHKRDLQKLQTFQNILKRAHALIRRESRKKDVYCAWFEVPNILFGVPRFDVAACIAYVMDQLQENHFMVKYYNPNTIFISWKHWVPKYIRDEIKERTGVTVNEYGEVVPDEVDEDDQQPVLAANVAETSAAGNSVPVQKPTKKYVPITSYRPTGKF